MVFEITSPIIQNGTQIGVNTKSIFNLIFENNLQKPLGLGIGIGSIALFGIVIYLLIKKK